MTPHETVHEDGRQDIHDNAQAQAHREPHGHHHDHDRHHDHDHDREPPRDGRPGTLLGRFDAAAERDPEAVAVRAGQERVTYGALADASRTLAERLAPLVQDRSGPVATLMEPGPAQVCAALAAMRCGKPYLPVDPAYPRHHIDRILADAAPAALAEPAPSGDLGISLTAGRWGDEAEVTGDDAYVIYTSGSTGSPKGIVIQHRGILNLLDECQARRTLPPRSRHGSCASPGFDAAVLEAWTSLTSGGELVVTPEALRWQPEGFADWLAEEHIAHAYIPAAFLPALARGLREGLGPRWLRRAIVAVEPIPRGLLGEIKRALPELTLINGYGPTEAAVCVSMYEVDGSEQGSERTPIGTAIRATDLRVEPLAAEPAPDGSGSAEPGSGSGEPVPGDSGVRGELHIGGAGVGRYLHAERIERPAYYWRTGEDGTPLPYYRSGDIVRADGEGMLTFLGRVDDMVKVRGYRVEPGDVEHALLGHPGLAQAVVLKQSAPYGSRDREGTERAGPEGAGREGHEQLVAHVVAARGTRLVTAEVHRRLTERLPWYAVPHRVVVREAFPLTVHGKIDKHALVTETPPPSPSASGAADTAREADPAPYAGADPRLLSLWRGILAPAGTPDPRASFLANGGDSLAAGRMAAGLAEQLGRRVKVLDILLAAGLDDLQAAVDSAPAEPPASTPVPERPDEPAPASYGQRGLWFHDALHPGSIVYNEPLTLRLRGALDVDALSRALAGVVGRHEALRTDLVLCGEELRQRVRAAEPGDIPVRDLRSVPEGERAGAEEQAVRETVRQPFDLAAGPHLRSLLLRSGEREHLLVLALHHSAFDGASADVVFEELAALYTAELTGAEPQLAPPPGQYADHARRQHALVAGGHLEADLAYWREQLEGLPPAMKLPSDFPRPAEPTGDGALVFGRLPRELLDRVDELAREAGATRYAAFLAALHLLLARYCGTQEVAVGAPFSGRDAPGTERAVGYYLNTLPLRADLDGEPTFRQLLARTRQTVGDAWTHQRVPYALLAERLGLTSAGASASPGPGPGPGGASPAWSSPAENPLLQVCLVPEDIYRHEMTFAGIASTFEYYDTGIAKFDLTVNLIPDAESGGMRLTAEYRTDLFGARRMERLLGHLRTLLESAAAEPDVPVARLPMLTAGERAQLLGEFAGDSSESGDSAQPAAGDGALTRKWVHERVDHWAARTPDATALVGEQERYSYQELTQRADRLAYYLAERGAEPGTRIGVALPRSTDAVIAFLAVLKTGAAYVPLDPAYPEHRLSFMAEDAGLLFTLTPALLREEAEVLAGGPADAPAVALTGDDIAYVIYTSGSTGRPKGVAIPHRAVADLALGAPRWAGIGQDTRLLLLASVSFDMAAFDIWATLVAGARLVVAPEDAVTADRIGALITRHCITHGDMATALFHRQAEEDPTSLAGLRTLVVGGEILAPRLAAAALAAAPGLRLINGYGPTEATTYSTAHPLTRADEVASPVPIGRPIPGTRVRILGAGGQPVPIGVTGELHLGGPGLALGYLDRPELTAERFTDDPFTAAPGERLYRTGDLARWRSDGTIDYAGRTDEQVKLYGYRVEPGEAEAVLREHPGVTDALVTRREERPGSPYLAAYYTTAAQVVLPAGELAELAAERLPSYMVPRVFTALERFPVAAGGKIDRAALPAPVFGQDGRDGSERDGQDATDTGGARDAVPHDAVPDDLASVQEQIAAIWREVVILDTLGPDDRLFDIGGASLHVARIHERVAARFGLAGLRMIDLFSWPTVRSYAAHVHHLAVQERGAGEPDEGRAEDGAEDPPVRQRPGEQR